MLKGLTSEIEAKVPFSDAKMFCGSQPKFKQRGQTLEYFVKKMQME